MVRRCANLETSRGGCIPAQGGISGEMSCPRERRKAGDAANASRDSPRVLMNSHGALHLARVLRFVMCFPAFLPTQLLIRTLSTSYHSCSTDKETEAQKNYEAPRESVRMPNHRAPGCRGLQRHTRGPGPGSCPFQKGSCDSGGPSPGMLVGLVLLGLAR